jgi:GTP 3',8-cyclase
MAASEPVGRALVDRFGRHIDYVRLSVTDRCDLRCLYCMPERMRFRPRAELLTCQEIVGLADLLIARGVTRIRLTGGEPLVRRDFGEIVTALGERLGSGLQELTLTTNGTQLEHHGEALRQAGVRRINVSLDSLDPARFAHLTRGGDLGAVLRGLEAARVAGLAIKINMVALKGLNEGEIELMLRWCAGEGFDLTLIEAMPMGPVEDRSAHFLPLDAVRRRLEERFTLLPSAHRSGGPARYFQVAELGLRLGFIAPLTGNFCSGCNRVRITATGTLYGCLGREQKVELREALRVGGGAAAADLLDRAIAAKPLGHNFHPAEVATPRHMNVTGG